MLFFLPVSICCVNMIICSFRKFSLYFIEFLSFINQICRQYTYSMHLIDLVLPLFILYAVLFIKFMYFA